MRAAHDKQYTDRCTAPAVAYMEAQYHTTEGPLGPTMYDAYRFLGRIARTGCNDIRDAKAEAVAKYGDRARVFTTARYYIAYRID